MTKLELSYKTSTTGLFRYLNLSDDWMLQLALKHEKKGLHSVVKAKKFAREIDLDLETEFDGEMKNTENAQKLKRIAKEKERRLFILPGSQNLYMVNTPSKAKKLM